MSSDTSANLERSLKPAGSHDLVRLGRDHDGGYLVDRRDVLASTALISLGINDDYDLHAPRVRDFVAATSLKVAHVHANNWVPVSDLDAPHSLDQANNAALPEISIRFD